MMIKIKLDEIRIDGGTQQRCEINQDIVSEYASALIDGIEFPAVTLFLDGVDYWLADGFHRVLAHQRVKSVDIHAEVIKGNKRDALLYSTGANNTHGLRVTNADKRKSVLVLLSDPEWSQWSNRQIAKHCYVSHTFVENLRSKGVATLPLSEKKVDNSLPVEDESNILSENSVAFDGETKKILNEQDCKQRTTQDEGIKNSNETVSGNEEEYTEVDKLKDDLSAAYDTVELYRNIAITGKLPPEEVQTVNELIAEYKKTIIDLKRLNESLTISRNQLMKELADEKRLCQYQVRRVQKLEKELKGVKAS
jgi:hypothetical protein